jgi:hypothetical protein
MAPDTGPWRLAGQLRAWAEGVEWCEWVELAGSLGRGAGDEMSDVDAGLGVSRAIPYDEAVALALAAVLRFAPVADSIVQPYGEQRTHLIVQYADGHQLSLVVSVGDQRPGLAPGSQALFDRTGRLRQVFAPSVLTASRDQQREWAFLAWWGLADVAKHAHRGSCWRALTSLNEVRDLVWQLHAASLGLDYPSFGAVSVENAGLPAPYGIEASLCGTAEPSAIIAAAQGLARVLDPLSAHLDVPGLRAVTFGRLHDAPERGQG